MSNGTELARVMQPSAEVRRYDGLTMAVAPAEALRRVQELQAFVATVMVSGTDYGIIPGTDKPTLFQPGAQKLCEIYGLAPRFSFVEAVKDWDRLFFYFECRCTLESRRDGSHVGEGLGSCNSRESKYAYRWLYDNQVPKGLDKSKLYSETRQGRNGGEYTRYRVPNDDLASVVNTIMKMAMKRALVAAVIGATRSSGMFNQDLEDMDLPEEAVGKAEAVRSWEQGDDASLYALREAEVARAENMAALSFVVKGMREDAEQGRFTGAQLTELMKLATDKREKLNAARPAVPAQAPPAPTPQAQPAPPTAPAAAPRRARAPKPDPEPPFGNDPAPSPAAVTAPPPPPPPPATPAPSPSGPVVPTADETAAAKALAESWPHYVGTIVLWNSKDGVVPVTVTGKPRVAFGSAMVEVRTEHDTQDRLVNLKDLAAKG